MSERISDNNLMLHHIKFVTNYIPDEIKCYRSLVKLFFYVDVDVVLSTHRISGQKIKSNIIPNV